ncbi:MAG: NAD-dependent deacylase [Limnochordaceae bacterium]|nr:NAD-dependent deacylase [Limnochordaceae bacterium]
MQERNQIAAQIARLLLELRQAGGRVLAFTGAGISTASGIPDFRSPGTGLWERVDPEQAMSWDSFRQDPVHFYQVGLTTWLPPLWRAQPNPAHKALAQLERAGLLTGVITQNIDGLHQMAGSRRVWEIHGSVRTASCPTCGRRVPLLVPHAWLAEKARHAAPDALSPSWRWPEGYPPRCPDCGVVLKPDVVLFGEPLPASFEQAWDETARCTLMIVIGSSLEVAPAAYLPERVGRLIINNLQPTACDERAEWVVRTPAAEIWPAVVDALTEANPAFALPPSAW